jgi:hypothetical protein
MYQVRFINKIGLPGVPMSFLKTSGWKSRKKNPSIPYWRKNQWSSTLILSEEETENYANLYVAIRNVCYFELYGTVPGINSRKQDNKIKSIN